MLERPLPAPPTLEIGDARRPAELGAVAGPGISSLQVKAGLLVGRLSKDVPVLLFRRRFDAANHPLGDRLARVEIRMRASAGTRLWLAFDAAEKVSFKQHRAAASELGWPMSGELKADGELHTYTLTSPFEKIPAAASRNILIRPSNEKGARFGIESLRLVFESDELAQVESGVGWRGLGEIYREVLAQRPGERIRLSLTLPPRPVLDVSLGTPNNTPVRFRAWVHAAGSSFAPEAAADSAGQLVIDRSVTWPGRWESLRVPLDRFEGEEVTLVLEVASEPDAIGYWGTAAVRTRSQTSAGERAANSPPRHPTPEEIATQPPQGVILVVADALRRDHLNAYGYPRRTAPRLAALADQGALFRDVVAQATWTKVSIPSLLTGLHPSTHGVLDFPDRLPEAAETLAETFREAGYATLSLSSDALSGRFSNLQQGFESVHEMGSLSEQHSSKTAREYVDRTLDWLGRNRDQPFFVFLHLTDPHSPYPARPPYDAMWAATGRAAEMESARRKITPQIADPLRRRFFMPNRGEVQKAGFDPEDFASHQRDAYDGSIRGLDAEIGRLIERLRELDLDRKTLVVFTSDHGEEFFDHGRSFHGQSVYGELSGIPLILWQPGVIAPGTVVEQTVQSIDIAPTILGISQLPIPAAVQGHSLEPLFSARGRWTPRPAVTIKARTTHEWSPSPRDTASFSLIDDGWKLVRHEGRSNATPRFELFNHGEDPLDAHDLATEFPQTVERLADLLTKWRASVESLQLAPDDPSEVADLRDAERQRLRALGYAQ